MFHSLFVRASRCLATATSTRYLSAFALGLGLAMALAGCQSPPREPLLHRYHFQSPHMGTLFSITLHASDQTTADAAATAAFRRISELEDKLSDYQADSELNSLRDKPVGRPTLISEDLFNVLARAQEISRRSGGAFDVTAGPYIRLWRFARKRKVLPTREEISSAAAGVGWRKLKLDPAARTVTLLASKMQLDVGGIAKGFAADEALKLLKGRGLTRALVAASGDIALGDPPPGKRGWRIGISPIDAHTNAPVHYLFLANAGVSTSGDSEQFTEINGVRYSHIVSPFTGLGLTNRIQATVVAPNATTTDALATTVCILGPRQGLHVIDETPGASAMVFVKTPEGVNRFVSRRFPGPGSQSSD